MIAALLDMQAELRAAHKELHDLRDRFSVKKNGHTWGDYLAKWVTPQNILLVVLGAITIGARVERIETGVEQSQQAEERFQQADRESLADREALHRQIASLQATISAQNAVIDKQRTLYATQSDVARLREQISRIPTRDEVRSAVSREIVPKLQRIEESVKPDN